VAGNVVILLHSRDRSLVLDHCGGGIGRVFIRLLDGGIDIDDWLSDTKIIQLDTVGHGLSIPWRPVFGVVVTKCSRCLKKRHQLDRTQIPKVENAQVLDAQAQASAAWDFHRWFGIGHPDLFSERRLAGPPKSRWLVFTVE